MRAKRGADIKRQVKELIQSDLPELYSKAKELIKDPKVPTSARARLLSDIFRASGLFEQDDAAAAKEQHEMTAEELADEIYRLEQKAAERATGIFD